MTTREAWLTVIILTLMLMATLAVAGLVSEVVAPQTEIGTAWSQAPR